MKSNNTAITIRRATSDDVADLVRLQRMMFEATGFNGPADLSALEEAAAAYFTHAIAEGAYHGWLAVTESGWPVAAGGLVVQQHPPSPDNLSGQVAYIANVVTDPEYRGQSIARRLVQTMLRWASDRGITQVALHAPDDRHALYEMLGFKASNEMRLNLA